MTSSPRGTPRGGWSPTGHRGTAGPLRDSRATTGQPGHRGTAGPLWDSQRRARRAQGGAGAGPSALPLGLQGPGSRLWTPKPLLSRLVTLPCPSMRGAQNSHRGTPVPASPGPPCSQKPPRADRPPPGLDVVRPTRTATWTGPRPCRPHLHRDPGVPHRCLGPRAPPGFGLTGVCREQREGVLQPLPRPPGVPWCAHLQGVEQGEHVLEDHRLPVDGQHAEDPRGPQDGQQHGHGLGRQPERERTGRSGGRGSAGQGAASGRGRCPLPRGEQGRPLPAAASEELAPWKEEMGAGLEPRG